MKTITFKNYKGSLSATDINNAIPNVNGTPAERARYWALEAVKVGVNYFVGSDSIGLHEKTLEYVDAMDVLPVSNLLAVNSRIVTLIQGEVWDKIYAMYMLDLSLPTACLINMINPTSTRATNFGCTHVPNVGHKATSTNTYIDSGINVSQISGINKDNIGISTWVVGNPTLAVSNFVCGFVTTASQTAIGVGFSAGVSDGRICMAPNSGRFTDPNPGTGIYTATRTSSTTSKLYKNGAELANIDHRASLSVPDANMYLIGVTTKTGVIYDIPIKFTALHKHLTLQEHQVIHSAFNNNVTGA